MDKVQRDLLAALEASTLGTTLLASEVTALKGDINAAVAVGQRSARRIRVLYVAVALVAVSALLTGISIHSARKATSRANIACTANNATSKTIADILHTFQAGVPTKPPAGSTPAQVKAFNEGLVRSRATYAAVFERLAASGC